MHLTIRADVPEPLWDQWKGVMVLPAGLTEEQADDAVAQLVRERSGDAVLPEAAERPLAR